MNPKERARSTLEEVFSELDGLSRWLYDNPEVAYQEHQASVRIADLLRRWGFEVEHPAYGLETAFAARAGTNGPEVVICAEYDALPGIGHACGHNIIAAAAVGAGKALLEASTQLDFRLTVLGTPAEEHYGGKVDLIEAGAFADAAAAMMIHPSNYDVVDPNLLAVSHIDVEFHGKEAHASAFPHLGRNALDALVQSYVNLSTLRQHLHVTDKLHGIITHGGEAPNVIPAYTRSSWYVRAKTGARLRELLPRVEACFEAGALATGCTKHIEPVGHAYDELRSNPTMTELFLANAAALGRPMRRGAEMPLEQSGSTDMGNVSQVVPTIHPMLSIDCHPAVVHQRAFADHTLGEGGTRAIRDGALAMAWTVIDLATEDLWASL